MFGSILCLIGVAGMIRFKKNVFQKIHATSLIETSGALMILIGLMFYEGFSLVTFKLSFIIFLLLLTGPIATNVIAKIAIRKPSIEKNIGAKSSNL